jgi:hypothetical protein
MRRLNWTVIALVAGLVLLVLLVAYFATNRNSEQDKLTNVQVTTTTSPTHEKMCANKATYDLIKRELFRRAAQLRGSDQAAYDSLAGYAVARMENPVMVSEDGASGAVNCSGSLSLDLPPGVEIEGGRRTLMADVDYGVDANGNVAVRNADAIIVPLSTLVRVAPAPSPVVSNEGDILTPEETSGNEVGPPPAQSPTVPQPPTPAFPQPQPPSRPTR